MVLTCLGSKAVKEGKTVIHYTMELSDKVIGRRYDSCITKVPLGDLNSFKEQVYEEISDVANKSWTPGLVYTVRASYLCMLCF